MVGLRVLDGVHLRKKRNGEPVLPHRGLDPNIVLQALQELEALVRASATVLPSNVTFLSASVESSSAGSLNGGFRKPSLDIISFWFEVGMESASAISSERSSRVASEGKEKLHLASYSTIFDLR
ncbi:unnamed protein product [Diplocarpon coronariae]